MLSLWSTFYFRPSSRLTIWQCPSEAPYANCVTGSWLRDDKIPTSVLVSRSSQLQTFSSLNLESQELVNEHAQPYFSSFPRSYHTKVRAKIKTANIFAKRPVFSSESGRCTYILYSKRPVFKNRLLRSDRCDSGRCFPK